MRNILLSTLVLFLSFQASSQTFIGLRSEPGFANLLFWDKPSWGFQSEYQEIRSRFAHSGGVEFTHYFKEGIGIRTGLFLLSNGYKTYYSRQPNNYPVRADRMYCYYLSLPAEMIISQGNFYLAFGPNVNYLIANRRTFSDGQADFEYNDIPALAFGLKIEPGVQFYIADKIRGFAGVFLRTMYNAKGNINYGFTGGVAYRLAR
ncbi:outer membrane beta-barrel protein [Cytophagaceae bacterium ABcell3]|nr:outer membrane beta-barrel protein [Cytophagaceae bacterium ABcell3]